MIKFNRLDLEYFCCIEKASIGLSDQGLVVVTGKNLDEGQDGEDGYNNGSGKSTAVVESLCWVLHGKTTKGGNADSVTPMGNGKGTKGSVAFEDGSDSYTITRYRKHSKMGNKICVTKNGDDISRSTAAENNKLITDIIGISYDAFLYTTVLGPSSFKLSSSTDQGRKQILEDITGTSIYEEAKLAAREKAKQANQEMLVNAAKVDELERYLASYVTQRANLQAQIDSGSDLLRLRTAEAVKLVDSYKSNLDALAAAAPPTDEPTELLQIPQLEAMAVSVNKAEKDAYGLLVSAKAEHSMLLRSLQDLNGVEGKDKCGQCGSDLTEEHLATERESRQRDVDSKYAEIIALQESHNKQEATSDSLTQALHNLNKAKNNHAYALSQHATQVSRIQEDLNRAQKALDDVAAWDPCAGLVSALRDLDESHKLYEGYLQTACANLAKSKKDVDDYTFWVSSFQDLRVTAIEGALEFINSRLANYASKLFKDMDLRLAHLEGKIVIQASVAGGTYESASGGERDRIDLCLAFALLDLARQCTQWGSNLLVLDEIAVHVDSKGVEDLMGVVGHLSSSIESVFMISHNPIFDGYGDKLMTVTKSKGVSAVTLD